MSRPPTPAQPGTRLAPIQRQARLRERLHPTHRNLRSELLATAAFLAPALALLAAFRLYPAAVSVAQSLQGGSLQAYRELFADTTFLKSVRVTLAYAAMASPATVAVSLLLALVLQGSGRVRSLVRTACFLPSTVSMSVVAVTWGMILDPHFGLANSVLSAVGLPRQLFLASPVQALQCLAALSVWRNAGYWMMFFLSGMEAVPKSVYEAAQLDGASPLQCAVTITVPLLAPTLGFVLVSNTVVNCLAFAPVFILTRGGPLGSTNVLMYEAYKSAFTYLDMPRSSAISTLVLAAVFALSFLELKLIQAGFGGDRQ